MRTKASHPALLLRDSAAGPLVMAYFEWSQLKQLYRQGWLRRGVPADRCESVAEHTFSMAALAMVLADACAPALNALKVLRLALLHDFGEIYAGDITPADDVDPADKHARERRSIHRVLDKLPNGDVYVALWQEYEAGASPEARFVRQIDRLDMALQAVLYERAGDVNADEFLASAAATISDADLQTVLRELDALRATAKPQAGA
jgi:putative hydrolase of HD superfamily